MTTAPLPPGAELDAAVRKHELLATVHRFTGDILKSWVHRLAAAFLRRRISNPRATGAFSEGGDK